MRDGEARLVHGRGAATVSAHVRRVTLIAFVVLACCAPARAALPAHAGHAIVAGTPPRSLEGLRAYPDTLVELTQRSAPAEFALRGLEGKLIAPPLALWRLPTAAAERLLPSLLAGHLVRSVTPDLPLRTGPGSGFLNQFTDPLSPTEWWPSHVGADTWTSPGPGFPLTMIDSGVDLSHEEFATRPNTTALDAQTFTANEEELHGTATASVAAAPQNNVGIVGI